MNNRLFVGFTLTFLAISVIALLSAGWNDGMMRPGWGMMGPWMMASWMGFNPLGWLIILVAFLAFLAALVLWVWRNWRKRRQPTITCPNCRRSAPVNRYTCEYCGVRLL